MTSNTRNLCLQYLSVLLCAGAVYGVSCAPGLLWQDSGIVQYRVLNHDVTGVFGLALSHPLFYHLAGWVKALPVGSLPWRVNMIAALAGAVTVANLFLFVRLWLGSAFPAMIAALSLGVAHTFWQHASMAETYTLWSALFTVEMLCLLLHLRTGRRRYLYGLALANGLALSVHLLAVISAVCYGVYLSLALRRRTLRPSDMARLAAVWGVGAAPYGWLIVQSGFSTGDWAGTLSSALFGDRWRDDVLNVSLSAKIVRDNLLYLVLNFPTPNLICCVVGVLTLIRQKADNAMRGTLLGLTLLYLLFASRYTVPDRYAFFIPFYMLVALLMGLGVQTLLRHARFGRLKPALLALALAPIGVYAGLPTWARTQQLSLGTRADLPYRDDYRFFLQPWKTGDDGAARFAREALAQVEADALIYADMTTVPALLFVQQDQGLRPDVDVVSEAMVGPGAPRVTAASIGRLLETRPVYMVSPEAGYSPRFIRETYALHRRGLLWRVEAGGCPRLAASNPESRCSEPLP